jgi:hypothetical protein
LDSAGSLEMKITDEQLRKKLLGEEETEIQEGGDEL